MNPTEFTIAAGCAIAEWHRGHIKTCVLSVMSGKVICEAAPKYAARENNPLYISIFEMERGMTSLRWTSIGAALHNLNLKELACHKHRKH